MVRRFIVTALPYLEDSPRTLGIERASFLAPYFIIYDCTEKCPLVKAPDSSTFSLSGNGTIKKIALVPGGSLLQSSSYNYPFVSRPGPQYQSTVSSHRVSRIPENTSGSYEREPVSAIC